MIQIMDEEKRRAASCLLIIYISEFPIVVVGRVFFGVFIRGAEYEFVYCVERQGCCSDCCRDEQ